MRYTGQRVRQSDGGKSAVHNVKKAVGVFVGKGGKSRHIFAGGVARGGFQSEIGKSKQSKAANGNITFGLVIVGGGLVGCELAVYLCEEKGYTDVTVVEGASELMGGGFEPMPLPNKLMLIDLMKFHGVKVLTDTMLDHIDGDKVFVKRNGEVSALETDSVVMSIGFDANDELYKEINANIPKKVWLLGDAKMPSNIMFGIRDANAIAREI